MVLLTTFLDSLDVHSGQCGKKCHFWTTFGVPLFMGSNLGSYYCIIHKGVGMYFGGIWRYVEIG